MKKNTDKEKNVYDVLKILEDTIIVLGTTLITLSLINDDKFNKIITQKTR